MLNFCLGWSNDHQMVILILTWEIYWGELRGGGGWGSCIFHFIRSNLVLIQKLKLPAFLELP